MQLLTSINILKTTERCSICIPNNQLVQICMNTRLGLKAVAEINVALKIKIMKDFVITENTLYQKVILAVETKYLWPMMLTLSFLQIIM